MNITQIKSKLDLVTLDLNTATDKDNKPTVDKDGNVGMWMRHWDNDNRVAVSIHKELMNEIKADSSIASLGLQFEEREGTKGTYKSYRIVKFAPAEHTL